MMVLTRAAGSVAGFLQQYPQRLGPHGTAHHWGSLSLSLQGGIAFCSIGPERETPMEQSAFTGQDSILEPGDAEIAMRPVDDDTPTGVRKGIPRRWLKEHQMDEFEKCFMDLMDRAVATDLSEDDDEEDEDDLETGAYGEDRIKPRRRRKKASKKPVEVSFLAACRDARIPYTIFLLERQENHIFRRRCEALENLKGDRIEGQFDGFALGGDRKFVMAATLTRRAAKERKMLRENEFSITTKTTVQRPIPGDDGPPQVTAADGIPAIQMQQAEAMRLMAAASNPVDAMEPNGIVEAEAYDVQGE